MIVTATESSGSIRVVAEGRTDVVEERNGGTTVVRCPEGADVTVGTSSGSIRCTGRLGAVRVSTDSGSIEVDDAGDADLRAVSGTIRVLGHVGSCRASTNSGDIEIRAAGDVRATVESGSVRVEQVDGDVVVRVVSGSVDVCVGDRRPDVRAHSDSGSVRCAVVPGRDGTVEVHAVSGSITIRS